LNLARTGVQVIDGVLHARENGELDPWVELRAVDGSWWDVIAADEHLQATFEERFPDAAPLEI
jgi:hypothetical protein